MATISIGLANSGVVNGTRNYTISDADVTRWIAAYRVLLNMPTATSAQVLAAWADDMIDTTKRAVKGIEARATLPAEISISST